MFVKEKIEKEKVTKTYRRIDEFHPVDIYLGYSDDNYPSMSIALDGRIIKVNSSNAIKVDINKKTCGKINLTFKLLDKDKTTIFYKFCEDIIESTRDIKCSSYQAFIISRWNKWKGMFKRPNTELLTQNQVVGLIGELLFLRDYMIVKYGKENAIKAWGGPSKSHKDYEINNTWYEIKTVKQSSTTVKISSMEQLDSNIDGNLVVYTLEETNENVDGVITLNKLVEELYDIFDSFELFTILQSKFLEIGYEAEDEYDAYNYRYIKDDTFIVTKGFPRITSEDLIDGVIKVSYNILLKDIKKFLRVD